MEAILKENPINYSCAYYDDTKVPLLQFMIIDEDEVVFFSREIRSSLLIKHAPIAKLFSEYYENIWSQAKKIKVGKKLDEDALGRVRQRYGVK